MNGRERILAQLSGGTTDRLPAMPITMQYAANYIGASYRDYAFDHRVLVEAQIRTAERFNIDHVSCISDPAREAADCGAAIEVFEDQPPAFIEENALLVDKKTLASLRIPDSLAGGRMTDRVRAVALFKERVGNEKLIEGWVEGPCAQGADLRGINTLMLDFYDDPDFVRDLFQFILEMETQFAKAQIDAGADLIGIGDAAASLAGPQIYSQLIQPVEMQLADRIRAMGAKVRLHICGNTRFALAGMGQLGCDIVDLDYPVPISEGRAAMGAQQILLGNINPVKCLLNGAPREVDQAVQECHRQAGPAFIVGAGCEVPRETPEENLEALIRYAIEHAP